MVKKAKGEFYSGSFRNETPRFAVFENRRIEVIEILRRTRIFDSETGNIRDVFICLLADGSTVLIESPFP